MSEFSIGDKVEILLTTHPIPTGLLISEYVSANPMGSGIQSWTLIDYGRVGEVRIIENSKEPQCMVRFLDGSYKWFPHWLLKKLENL